VGTGAVQPGGGAGLPPHRLVARATIQSFASARLGWAAFYLVFGIPGLLTFLSVQEWPARESCPNCKKTPCGGP